MKSEIVVDASTGARVALCSYAQAKTLQIGRYITAHARRANTWVTTFATSVIRSALRAKLGRRLPVAEACQTVVREGRGWAHHLSHCLQYGGQRYATA